MSEPLTRDDLVRALVTQSDVLKRELSDRFDHYEKRQDKKHEELIRGFAQVIENVNAHTDERVGAIEKRLEDLTDIAALRETMVNLDKRLARLEATR